MSRFSDEVVVHGQQRHPNIVQLMGVYYPPRSQLPMLIMEYLPFSLTQCLEKKVLTFPMKYSILLDVAKGVCYLHGKDSPIVHRDLTANNVLLTSSYTAKISDLGVSRLADTFKKQQLSVAPGNSMVMPPEALEDDPVYDHKLDVFSYGCLIIHVLTNEFPEPTKRFVKKSRDVIIEVSEWDRRLKYIQQVPNENALMRLAKECLNDNPTDRPKMTACIQFMQSANLPLMKSITKLAQENDALFEDNNILRVKNAKLEVNMNKLQTEYQDLEQRSDEFVAKTHKYREDCMTHMTKYKKEYDDKMTKYKKEYDDKMTKMQEKYQRVRKKRDNYQAEYKLMLEAFNEAQEEHQAVIANREKEHERALENTRISIREEHQVVIRNMEMEHQVNIAIANYIIIFIFICTIFILSSIV